MRFSKTILTFTLLASMLGSTAFAAQAQTAPPGDSDRAPQVEMKAAPDSEGERDNRGGDKENPWNGRGNNWNNRWHETGRNHHGHTGWHHGRHPGENDHQTYQAIETTAVKATVAGVDISGTIKGSTAMIKMPASGALSMIKIEGTEGVTLTVNSVKGANTKTYKGELVFADMNRISIAEILGNPENPSIDVATLRAALGDSDQIIVSGTLCKENYKSQNVKLILDFSKTEGQYGNAYFDAAASGKTVTVTVKQPDALISTIGMKDMILGVSESAKILPASVSLGEGADKVIYTNLLDPATQNAIREKIGTVCGTWETAKLSDLELNSDELNLNLKDLAGRNINVIFTGM